MKKIDFDRMFEEIKPILERYGFVFNHAELWNGNTRITIFLEE